MSRFRRASCPICKFRPPPPVAPKLEPAPAGGRPGRAGRWHWGLLLTLVFGALALTLTVSLLAAQTTDDPWTEAAMTTPRNSHSLTLLPDGRALAAGGWDGASPLASAGGAWIDLNVKSMTQAWVSNPADNHGLVLLQEAASGYVIYDFCSELGWSLNGQGLPPCSPALAPKLTLRYHLVPPPPVKATFQQGISGYSGATATYFDGAAGYNNTGQWHVGQSNSMKALLRFDLPTVPITATVDEATLQLYQTGRSNGNTLTLGAHQVLAGWIDAEANKTQRQNGVNWAVVGMGSGSDYVAAADGTADLASAGGAWVDLDVKAMVQAWAANPDDNHGLVLTQEAASGSVYYNFCSELGWGPCTAAQAPQLTIWYR